MSITFKIIIIKIKTKTYIMIICDWIEFISIYFFFSKGNGKDKENQIVLGYWLIGMVTVKPCYYLHCAY